MSYPTLEEEIEFLRAEVVDLEDELSHAKRVLRDRERELERSRSPQAGPLMVRHKIDGHDVLLPTDAVLHSRIGEKQP